MHHYLKLYTPADTQKFLSLRRYETKAGEKIFLPKERHDLHSGLRAAKEAGVKFALLGIPESIGPLANWGRGGAEKAWAVFLKRFLNMQHNRFFDASKIWCVGEIETKDLMAHLHKMKNIDDHYLQKLRSYCVELDGRVAPVIRAIIEAGIIPIIIGGGHNNAYGILKGASSAVGQPLNCLNCDPHADFRPLEGRHSGNGFSYAFEEDHLNKYFIFGMHEGYNSEMMLEQIDKANKKKQRIRYVTFEDILDKNNFDEELQAAVEFISENDAPAGLELDMDAIANMASSAYTPSGISLEQARQYIITAARSLNVKYLHLPEAAPDTIENGEAIAGKALAYLVADFIMAQDSNNKA